MEMPSGPNGKNAGSIPVKDANFHNGNHASIEGVMNPLDYHQFQMFVLSNIYR